MTRGMLLVLLVFVSGCVSPYGKFYSGRRDLRRDPSFVEPLEPIQVLGSNDLEHDVRVAMRRGLVVIGVSAFNSGGHMTHAWYAESFARELGAQLVLVKSQYSHTVSGSIPITTPTSSTSHTTGSATAYGRGGSVTAYGSSTTTTYGTQTTYVPYAVRRSDYTAVFLARAPPPRLGAYPRELDESMRARLGSNAGILVYEVVEGSTAYSADVVPGDVILEIGGERVDGLRGYYQLLDRYQGSSPVLLIDRNGERIEKRVEIRVSQPRTLTRGAAAGSIK